MNQIGYLRSESTYHLLKSILDIFIRRLSIRADP